MHQFLERFKMCRLALMIEFYRSDGSKLRLPLGPPISSLSHGMRSTLEHKVTIFPDYKRLFKGLNMTTLKLILKVYTVIEKWDTYLCVINVLSKSSQQWQIFTPGNLDHAIMIESDTKRGQYCCICVIWPAVSKGAFFRRSLHLFYALFVGTMLPVNTME